MRTLLLASCLLLQCGDDPDPEPPAHADPPAIEAEAPSATSVTCEGLVRPCGGWEGCILVERGPDAARFEGVGALAGHFYSRDDSCNEGVCNDVCDPSSGVCRHGFREDLPTTCYRTALPGPAPFYCELVDGACVQHDLPPTSLSAGGRS